MARLGLPATAAVVAVLTTTPPSESAELPLLNAHPEGCNVTLTGQISEGDTDRLRQVIGGSLAEDERRFMIGHVRLCLDSPGGSFLEGLALARQLRQDGIATHVPAGAACLSACALAFLGGSVLSVEDAVIHLFQRSMHATARLGFHAPQLDIEAGNFTESEVKRAFALAIKAAAEIFARLDELGISRTFALDFFDLPEGQFYQIDTPERVQQADLRVTGLRDLPPRIGPERIAEICRLAFETFDPAVYEDSDSYASLVRTDLMELPAPPPLSQRSAYLLTTTGEGTLMWDTCEVEWQHRATDAFGPRLQLSHHVPTDIDLIDFDKPPPFPTDFDFLDFENPPPLSRASVLAQLDRPAQDSTSLSPVLAAPAGKTLASLASSEPPSFEGIWPATCAPVERSYEVWRVENFANLRDRPGFEGSVLGEVSMGARVTALSPFLEDAAILSERCNSTCRPVDRGTITPEIPRLIEVCRESGDVWWQVRTTEGVTGWLSAKFLKP